MIHVISDLHVGAGPLDDCDDELELQLVSFLEALAKRPGALELVVNGDFLDFAQAHPWKGHQLEAESSERIPLCFTEAQSVAKLATIAKEHEAIFNALRGFLQADEGHRLTILPGNHDADFFWPRVRERFMTAIAPEGSAWRNRASFHLESVYRPESEPGLWIEHGHQYDPVNSFFINGEPCWSAARPPILVDSTGEERLLECIGTRFLIRFINRIDERYPFVDNVKPFSKFIRLFALSALAPGYGPLSVTASIWALLKYLSQTLAGQPSDLLGLQRDLTKDAGEVIQAWVKGMSPAERKEVAARLREEGLVALNAPLEMWSKDPAHRELLLDFLAEHIEFAETLEKSSEGLLSIGGQDGTLSLAKEYSIDESKRLAAAARAILDRKEASAVTMGHTHEPVDPTPEFPYCNTGCWTRYYQGDASKEKLKQWTMLKAEGQARFPFSLRYLEASNGAIAVKTFDRRTA